MQRYIWFGILGALTILFLRAPAPPTALFIGLVALIGGVTGGFKKQDYDPHKKIKIKKQAKKITDIAYQATIGIPKNETGLIDKILYIDKLYRKKKIKKAESTFYKHILPKLVALKEKSNALAEIPGENGQQAQEQFAPKMLEAYRAVEDWCDHRIKAYSDHLTLDSEIDQEVLVKLTKYL